MSKHLQCEKSLQCKSGLEGKTVECVTKAHLYRTSQAKLVRIIVDEKETLYKLHELTCSKYWLNMENGKVQHLSVYHPSTWGMGRFSIYQSITPQYGEWEGSASINLSPLNMENGKVQHLSVYHPSIWGIGRFNIYQSITLNMENGKVPHLSVYCPSTYKMGKFSINQYITLQQGE